MKFNLFKNKNFLLCTLGNTVSIIGNVFMSTCLALYVLKITGSPVKFASVLALGSIPQLILGTFAGSLVDRFNKKITLAGLDSIRGIFYVLMFIITLTMDIKVAHIYMIVLFEALCQSFYSPAQASILPLILEKSDLVDGNLMQRMIIDISNILAPTLAVIFYDITGIGVIMLANGISFLFAAFCEIRLELKVSNSTFQKKSVLHDMLDGFKLYENKEILSISLNGMLTHMLVFPFIMVGIPHIMKNIFSTGNVNYGIVQSIGTSATLLTAFTVPLVKKYYRDLPALNSGMYGMITSIALFFLLSIGSFFTLLKNSQLLITAFLGLCMFVFNLSFSTYGVFYSTFNQKKVPHEYLGRFYSMLITLFALGRIFGLKLYGYLFSTNVLIYSTALAFVGMILKLLLNRMIKSEETAANLKDMGSIAE